MYERMLLKDNKPTFDELAAYCGDASGDFILLNEQLADTLGAPGTVTFPYGNNYGWGVAHRRGKQLICNVFAENGAFTVMLRLSDPQFCAVYDKVSKNTQALIDNKYPCGGGGWIHFRVRSAEDLHDVRLMLSEKCG